jgi:excisionase family DNA binding protein
MREIEWGETFSGVVQAAALTVAEAADREGVHERTVRRWIAAGALGDGAWQVGPQWRISSEALDARRLLSRRPRTRAKPTRAATPAAPTDAMGWPSA